MPIRCLTCSPAPSRAQWDEARQKRELADVRAFLATMRRPEQATLKQQVGSGAAKPQQKEASA